MKKLLLLFTLVMATSLGAWSQTALITGTVSSAADGSALPSVTVLVKGTNIGVISDAAGKYAVAIPASATTLVFQFLGFKAREIEINGQKVINVALELDLFAVDEVIVVGYGVTQKRDISGAISTIKGDNIKLMPVQSFDQALQGKAAGVTVTMPNGVLNNPPVIRVRGYNSISSSASPLIVVDGVPIFTGDVSSSNAANNALSDINPSDIQSMEILKDASATAIYGSRAANGVILITTKNGKGAKTKVTYDGQFGYTQPYNLFEVMNSTQYVEHKNLALANNPTALKYDFFIPKDADSIPIDTRWGDYVYQTGFQQTHSISISGSTPSTTYYLSVGYTDQEGMIKLNTYNRKNARVNLTHKLNKYISLGTNFSISNSMNRAPNTGSLPGQGFNTAGAGRLAFVLPPNLAPYLNNGSYNIAGSAIGGMGQPVPNYGYYNPVPVFDLCRFSSESDRLLANFHVAVEPLQGLTFKTAYGIDNLSVESQSFQTGLTGDSYASNGFAGQTFNRPTRWTWTNTANYTFTLANKLNTNFLIGTEEQYTKGNSWSASKTNVTDPFFTSYQGSWITAGMGGGGQYENYFISYFGRANFNWDRKYFFDVSIRRDGFSGLAKGNEFGTFGGASVMWNISKEKFISESPMAGIFSDLRLKASYGRVGNMSGIGSYSSLSLYNSGVYGAAPTWTFSQAGNPDLHWEASDKYDVGLSFGLLEDRLQVDLNYFYNDVNDLILNVPQSPSKGIPGNTIPMNVGSMFNRGIEFTLTSYNIAKPNFTWTTNFNFTSMKNEVTSLAPGVTEVVGITAGLETTSRTLVGYPIGNIFGVETRGVDPETGRRIFVNAAGKEVLYSHEKADKWSYREDGTKAPAIELTKDGKVLGSPIPKMFGGLDNTFTFKGFDLLVGLTYAFGFELYNGSKAGLRDQRWWNNSIEVYETAWKQAGDITNIPKPVFNDNVSNGSAFVISENVEKAGYVKLRSISAGYTFKKLPANLKIESIRLYALIFNAYVFTNYTGSDPEVSANGDSNLTPGIDRNTVPQARTYSFGVNINF
ncbi:MAG: SusC/RagA family TonB-linked outer membrane protein [Bacteroidales bacterium]|jgi:TonB-linked SusC/RagA family outer membrane protein